ncbi:hypothetical protein glysoja_013793 [Glycine soja]|nr:hypothetical protein glysoja_013793 [Glycine soja]
MAVIYVAHTCTINANMCFAVIHVSHFFLMHNMATKFKIENIIQKK